MSEPFSIARLARSLAHNSGLKGLSILLGAVSFYAIRGATSFEIRYDVPLDVVVEEGVAILEQDARTVQVTFRGSPDNLRHLEQKQIRAVLRVRTKALSGTERFPVSDRNVEGASGVRVVKVQPAAVSVTFDREEEKLVEVLRPRTNGKPLLGRVEIEYEPRFVKISGPRLRLKDKVSISTEPIDVDRRAESFTRTVRILPPSDTLISRIEPSEISVRVKIVTETVSRRFESLPVLAVVRPDSGGEVRFEPPFVNVVLEGRADVVDALTNTAVSVFALCAGLDARVSRELPVQVHLAGAPDVTASAEPDTVNAVFDGF